MQSVTTEGVFTPAKVLVVESNPAVAEMTVLVLAAAGYQTFQTASARQALRTQASLCPDVILLARALPDLAAEELCRELRARSAVPIIVLTTDHDPDTAESLLAEGASECVPLPVHTRELLDRITSRLRAHRESIATTRPNPTATPKPCAAA